MFMNLRDLEGWHVSTVDNADAARLQDSYFDDRRWAVRYFVVIGEAWNSRPIAISPSAIERIDRNDARIHVSLAASAIEKAPTFDLTRSMTRRQEASYASHFRFPYYWIGPGVWGEHEVPTPSVEPLGAAVGLTTPDPEARHLFSVHDFSGSHLHALDGEIGHVENFIVDDRSWTIRYLIADTSNWIGGRTVLIAPSQVRDVDWALHRLDLKLTRDDVRHSPVYDPTVGLTAEYERRLADHYEHVAHH